MPDAEGGRPGSRGSGFGRERAGAEEGGRERDRGAGARGLLSFLCPEGVRLGQQHKEGGENGSISEILALSVYRVGASRGDEPFAYPTEQCGLVLQGVAEVHLDGRVYRLEAGESIRFDSAVPHRIVNVGRTELRCIWAIIPPTF